MRKAREAADATERISVDGRVKNIRQSHLLLAVDEVFEENRLFEEVDKSKANLTGQITVLWRKRDVWRHIGLV